LPGPTPTTAQTGFFIVRTFRLVPIRQTRDERLCLRKLGAHHVILFRSPGSCGTLMLTGAYRKSECGRVVAAPLTFEPTLPQCIASAVFCGQYERRELLDFRHKCGGERSTRGPMTMPAGSLKRVLPRGVPADHLRGVRLVRCRCNKQQWDRGRRCGRDRPGRLRQRCRTGVRRCGSWGLR
jgi:hypothetical protein